MAPRLFTRQEAEEMLPYLAPLLFQLRALKQEHDLVQARAQEGAVAPRTNGHGPGGELRRAQAELRESAHKIKEIAGRIQEMGVELKDIDIGLVDFRAEHEGREVYLCWQLGEEHVAFWHELNTGYAGRRPLEDAGE